MPFDQLVIAYLKPSHKKYLTKDCTRKKTSPLNVCGAQNSQTQWTTNNFAHVNNRQNSHNQYDFRLEKHPEKIIKSGSSVPTPHKFKSAGAPASFLNLWLNPVKSSLNRVKRKPAKELKGNTHLRKKIVLL